MCHCTGLSLNSWPLTTWWIQTLPLDRLKKNKQLLSHAWCPPPHTHTQTHTHTLGLHLLPHVSAHSSSLFIIPGIKKWCGRLVLLLCVCWKGRIRVWQDNVGSSFLPQAASYQTHSCLLISSKVCCSQGRLWSSSLCFNVHWAISPHF